MRLMPALLLIPACAASLVAPGETASGPGRSFSTTALPVAVDIPAQEGRPLEPVQTRVLRDGTVLTHFAEGITHAGGAVRQVRVLQRGSELVVDTIPADGGFPTPAAYNAAGRSPRGDYQALTGLRGRAARDDFARRFGPAALAELEGGTSSLDAHRVDLAAAVGDVVQSGCVSINDSKHHVVGCYKRKLAQKINTSGEILGESFVVSGYEKRSGAHLFSLSGDMRHDYSRGNMEVIDWSPISQASSGSCRTQTYGLALGAVSWSQSFDFCPSTVIPRIENDPGYGANFKTTWAHDGGTKGAHGVAGVDTFRWYGVPFTYRGNFFFRTAVMASSGQRSCSGTSQTCT